MPDLCTLADVRLALELDEDAPTDRDALIEALIPIATSAIVGDASREFVPFAATTSDFEHVGGGRVNLSPRDLRVGAAPTITVLDGSHVGANVVRELAVADWFGEPVTALDGVYTSVVVPFLAGCSHRRIVRIVGGAGTWGFAAVPLDVKQAAVVTVRSWLSKPVADMAAALEAGDGARLVTPGTAGVFAVPIAAKRLYGRFRRHGVA